MSENQLVGSRGSVRDERSGYGFDRFIQVKDNRKGNDNSVADSDYTLYGYGRTDRRIASSSVRLSGLILFLITDE